MAIVQGVGIIEKYNYEEVQFEWKITDFFSVIKNEDNFYNSLTFPFKDSSWYLQLIPMSLIKPGFVVMFLAKNKPCKHSVEYNIGFKKLDGSVEQFTTGTIDETKNTFSDPNFLMRLSELRERVHELVPSNVLTVTCTMKSGTPHPTQSSVLNESKLEKLIRHDTLSKNYKDLFSDKGTCDTTLCVKDKEYTAHKTVLMARSSVFSAMFKHDTKEKQTNNVTIPDCDPESFNEFLEYLYSGELEVSSSLSALHLYETSDKYDVQELKEFCVNHLKENLSVQNVCDVAILADQYDDIELFSAAQIFFNKNLHEMFQSSEWEYLLKNNHRLVSKLLKGVPKSKFVK